jgi:hypothetical protein
MLSTVFLVPVISLGIYLIPAFLLRRKTYAHSQDYYVSSDHTPPGVIQNSSIACTLKIGMLGPFVAWGATGEFWPAIISSAFLGLGLYLIYVVRRPLLEFLGSALSRDQSFTINEFIARRHGNDVRVRLLASGLTVFAVTGLIICEMIGIATILKPILPNNAGLFYLSLCLTLASMVFCTVVSGNSGAMYSAQLQLGMLYLGLFGSTALLLYLQISALKSVGSHATLGILFVTVFCVSIPFCRRSRYVDSNIIRDPCSNADGGARALFGARLLRGIQTALNITISVFAALVVVVGAMELYSEGTSAVVRGSAAALLAGTRVPNMGLLALVLFPLFYQVVDVTNWQRIAAFAKDRNGDHDERRQWSLAFRNFFIVYATESPLAWLFMCVFGTLVAVSTKAPDGADIMQSFIRQLISEQNSVAVTALSLSLIGMFAMALSTMIPLFSASLCAVRYDILPALWPDLAPGEGRAFEDAKGTRRAVAAAVGALCLVILVAFYFIQECLCITFTSSKFLALVFAFSCAQLSFVPLVLGPLTSRTSEGPGTVQPGWALAILGISAVVGVGAITVYFTTGDEPWLWAAVPACLGTGVLLFAVARLQTARAA